MIRITHVIDGLSVGGAEVMLEQLVRRMDPDRFASEVISLTTTGPVGERLAAQGVAVHELGLRPAPAGAWRLAGLPGLIRRTRPDLVQTWLYHGDLLGGLSARIGAPRLPVVWGIHRSDLDTAWTKRRLALVAGLCARLSRRVPAHIVCCSAVAARLHIELGYDAGRIELIPNGFDLDAFARDRQARAEVRSELGIPDDAPAVGMVARLDPQKDHANLLDAMARVHQAQPEVHLVLCGAGVTLDDARFARLLEDHPPEGPVHALGLRTDIARIDAALDVAVLSSTGGEAFPLAVGEAMSAGVPCVVTDVGDAAELVGPGGRVVPPRDPDALAEAILELVRLPDGDREQLGATARAHVRDHYELSTVVRRYERLYEQILGG